MTPMRITEFLTGYLKDNHPAGYLAAATVHTAGVLIVY